MSHAEHWESFELEMSATGVATLRFNTACTELDAKVVNEIAPSLLIEVSELSFHALLIDMGNVSYVNSAFLAMCMSLRKVVQGKRATLAICSMSPYCQRVVKAAGFEIFLKIYETEEQANSSLWSLFSLIKAWTDKNNL